MPVDGYTHNFEFKIGDGGRFLVGKIEFNLDGKVSFKMTQWSEPIQQEVLQDFIDLTELLKRIFHSHTGIKEIKFKEITP